MKSDRDVSLNFLTPVILVGAAPTNLTGLDVCSKDWPIFAADGGVHSLLAIGRKPRAVIGDMDSVGDVSALAGSIEIICRPGQDDTDFQKCLRIINAPLLIGFGFLGARYDHSLSALHALACLPDNRLVVLVGHDDVMLRVCGDCQLNLPIGTRFSLWPLGRQTFLRSTGLAWPLDGLEFEIGKAIGTSNCVTEDHVKICAGLGDGYMVIVPALCLPEILVSTRAMAGLY